MEHMALLRHVPSGDERLAAAEFQLPSVSTAITWDARLP